MTSAAAIVLFLALPQLYVLPAGTVDLPLSTIATLLLAAGLVTSQVLPGMWAGARLRTSLPVVRQGLFLVLVGILAVRYLALMWSPDPRAGLQPIVLVCQFMAALLLMSAAARRDADLLRKVQIWYWPWVVVELLLVVVFRLVPAAEDAFLHTVGGVFAGQNTIAGLFSDQRNNVLDVAKSGGVFVNANVAGMFLGVNGLAALAVSSVTKTRWVRFVGLAALLGVPFTGSKLATVLALALPLAGLGLYRVHRMANPVLRRAALLVPAGLALAAVLLLLLTDIDVLRPLRHSLAGRAVIWGFGAESFRSGPVLGLGWGGWKALFPEYAQRHHLYQSYFPPHNVLLAAWSNTGLAGLVLTVAFFVLAIRFFVRAAAHAGHAAHTAPDRAGTDRARFATFGGTAFVWVVVQGMGENTDFFGEVHLVAVVALLIGYLCRPDNEDRPHDEERSADGGTDGGHADRRDRTAPAVPAVGALHHQPSRRPAWLPAVVRWPGRGAHRSRRAGRGQRSGGSGQRSGGGQRSGDSGQRSGGGQRSGDSGQRSGDSHLTGR